MVHLDSVPPDSSTKMSSLVIKYFQIVLLIVVFSFSLVHSDVTSGFFSSLKPRKGIKNVEKRSLPTFPPDSLFQVNVGITLAGELKRNSAVVVLAFQQNAPLPVENPSVVVAARGFSIYDHLVDVIASYGFNGSECLKKMICQIGQNPAYGGLLEDVITFVLSPSKHRSIQNDQFGADVDSLLESERLGKLMGNCTSAFPLCVQTPLDLISTFIPY